MLSLKRFKSILLKKSKKIIKKYIELELATAKLNIFTLNYIIEVIIIIIFF